MHGVAVGKSLGARNWRSTWYVSKAVQWAISERKYIGADALCDRPGSRTGWTHCGRVDVL